MRLAVLAACVQQFGVARADFLFQDFNKSNGIVLNGAAATSSCVPIVGESTSETQKIYPDGAPGENANVSPKHGAADRADAALPEVQRAAGDKVELDNVVTHDARGATASSEETARLHGVFGHRAAFGAAPETQCSTRVRLTPSNPFTTGSAWYRQRLPVLGGFETKFTFQISDHSRSCTEVKDQDFGLHHHKSCSVHGGDGFAFVIQGHPNGTAALGKGGAQLGYGGLGNSLAVDFDTWYNADGSDLLGDHISVRSMGPDTAVPNSATDPASRLTVSRQAELADGLVHEAMIRYYREVQYQYLDTASATPNLTPYLQDRDEGRRLGMLVIWLDEGIAADKPLLALPLNLASVLSLSGDMEEQAYLGFTAATGSAWEKHDVLSWFFCEADTCTSKRAVRGSRAVDFDYHLANRHTFSAHAQHVPMKTTRNQDSFDHHGAGGYFPDTTPITAAKVHYSQGQRASGKGPAYAQMPHTATDTATAAPTPSLAQGGVGR